MWSGASAAANAHLNDLVQLKLEDQIDQGADELRASMRAPGDAPRWVMDGCEALFDSVYDDLRDSLASYLMISLTLTRTLTVTLTVTLTLTLTLTVALTLTLTVALC